MSRVSSNKVFAQSRCMLFVAGAMVLLATGTLRPIVVRAQPVNSGRGAKSAWTKLCFDALITQSNIKTDRPSRP
jgi:hypothetical protein